jgi:hypothetical protein
MRARGSLNVTARTPVPYLQRMIVRAAAALLLTVALLVLVGCSGHGRSRAVDPSIHVPAALPPSPVSWSRYPSFPPGSCWTRPFGGGPPLQAAPSSPLPARLDHTAPAELVQRLLSRLGDNRYVLNIELASPPPITLQHLRGYFAGVRPPANSLWAFVSAPVATQRVRIDPVAAEGEKIAIAQWEAGLVVGALRDDFCANGGPPLVGWSIGRGGIGLSDRSQAFEQRFPNPSPAVFRRRAVLVGRRYGFTVQELRLLRPRQLAPLLIVRTDRDRNAFVRDVPAIMKLLDPTSNGPGKTAITFEGFFFDAEDARGPFVRVDNHYRGETEGGQWSWSRCVYPYVHSEPFGGKPCP